MQHKRTTLLWALFIFLISGLTLPALATQADSNYPLVNLFDRDSKSLSGKWQYIQDPLDNVITRNQVIKTKQRYTFFMDQKQETPGPLIEYDWSLAPTLNVPGDWNTQRPGLEFYEGTMWYRRSFDGKVKPGRRYYLYFEAANYRTHVFLNTELLGSHTGGYTPFAFDVTDKLKAKDNLLVVAVNNDRTEDAIPALASDWWNYGGITRPVHLVSVPETYIHYYEFIYDDADGGVINGSVKLAGNRASNQKVNVKIRGLDINQSATTDNDGMVHFTLPARDIKLWSPESPHRYTVAITAAGDSTKDKIGFRTLAVSGSDILLNGEPVFWRGISIHEEPIGPVGGRVMDKKAARALLQSAKDMGANFVRLAHYPHTELMTRLADEMGLMVWSEVPIYWGINFANPEMLKLGELMLLQNIYRDINRASIVVWGVANETPVNETRNQYLKTLIDSVRSTDSSRLVSAALMKDKSSQGDIIIVNDPLAAHLDVVSVNEYEGWYGEKTLDEVPDIKWEIASDKPLFFSEFGAGALAGYFGDEDTRWTEEYQAKFYANTLKMADKLPTMRGMSPWILKDFRSPRRYHQKYQEFWNRKGLISETGEKKLAFDVLKNYYEEKAK